MTYLRRKSRKLAAAERKARPIKREWLAQFPSCWHCGAPNPSVHEMVKRSTSSCAILVVENYFAACWPCHGLSGPVHVMPLAKQLAYKKINDPGCYDRLKCLELKDWAETAVTEDEVKQEIVAIQKQHLDFTGVI